MTKILEMKRAGYTNADIARQLGFPESTVRYILENPSRPEEEKS